MATGLQLTTTEKCAPNAVLSNGDVAWETQATCCHANFSLKSTPHHRDFRLGKEGDL